jgi:hypothetical protein
MGVISVFCHYITLQYSLPALFLYRKLHTVQSAESIYLEIVQMEENLDNFYDCAGI